MLDEGPNSRRHSLLRGVTSGLRGRVGLAAILQVVFEPRSALRRDSGSRGKGVEGGQKKKEQKARIARKRIERVTGGGRAEKPAHALLSHSH